MIQGDCLWMSALALKILSEGNTGNQKKLRLVSLSIYVGNCYLLDILDGRRYYKWFKGIVSVSQLGLENSVGGKYGRSEEAASGFFLQLCWELLSNEHTWSLSSLETFGRNCLCVSALALKILSEGNPGNQERLRLFSLSSYVDNRYLMNILYACLRWKRLEWIGCVCQPWAWKIYWREIRAIKSSCVCFLCPVLFGITI